MSDQKVLRWICSDPDCKFGRVIETVSEMLLHSQNQHKLIKFDKFRERVAKVFDDSNHSRLMNEQHYNNIVHSIQTLITNLKESIQIFENTFKQKLDDFYDQIHPKKLLLEISQAIMKQEEIDKEILNIYLTHFVNNFDLNPQTVEKLEKLQNQIQNFCQSQKVDLTQLFDKQLQFREVANVLQQPEIQIKQVQPAIVETFNPNLSSKEVIFLDNYRSATAKEKMCFVYFKGVNDGNKTIIKVEIKTLDPDDFLCKIGVVAQFHNLNELDGCYFLTQTGIIQKEQEVQQTKLKFQNGSIIKVRHSKKHPKKIFFQVDNNLNDKIQLQQEFIPYSFIIVMKNITVRLV